MLDKIIRATKKFDLFAFDKYLRFHTEDQHKTLTGGIFSIVLIGAFVIIFAGTTLSTLNRSIIIHSEANYRPNSPLQLGKKGNQPFKFAVGIQKISLLKQALFFQIWLVIKRIKRGTIVQQTRYSLEPCTRQAWAQISDEAGQIYDELQMKQWLCLPSNLTIILNGTNSAKQLIYAQLEINRCNSKHYTCVDDSAYDQFIQANKYFTLKFYVTNPSISPGQQDYLKLYLDDTNHFIFTHKNGLKADLFFSEYTIQTENSILPEPISSKKVQKGAYMDSSLQQIQNYVIDSPVLARVALRKSINSKLYQRSFRRIDDAISYIGGLFGGLVMMMIILNKFNEYSFLLQFGSQLFYYKQIGQEIKGYNFNILSYFSYLSYIFLNLFTTRWNDKFEQLKKYDQVIAQAEEQLGIDYLLKRIMFLQKVIELKYNPRWLRNIQLNNRMILEDIRQKRLDYNNHQNFRRIVVEQFQTAQRHNDHSPNQSANQIQIQDFLVHNQ